jgi:hypothetical protein
VKSKREPLEVEMKGSGTGPLKRERRRIACCVSTLRLKRNQTVCFSFWIIIQKQPKVQHLNTHSPTSWDKIFVVVLLLRDISKRKKVFSECFDPVQPSDVGADETVHRSIFAA